MFFHNFSKSLRKAWKFQTIYGFFKNNTAKHCDQTLTNYILRYLGARCRGFKSLHSDHENPCKLKVYKGFSLFIKASKIIKCTQSFHPTSGNFFVFKPVPYSLTYAVKFFTSAKRKGKANLRLTHLLRLVSPLLPQLSLHGFLWAVNSLSVASFQPPVLITDTVSF